MTDPAVPERPAAAATHRSTPAPFIRLRGVRQNNLKRIDLDLPLGQLIAVTGVSGSGKSTLAFDTLHAEGQRRYVEGLSSYARQFLERMDRPLADSIEGILPTVALEQGRRLRASRSTVGTLTEISAWMRILFAALARPDCPGCGRPVARLTAPEVVDEALAIAAGQRAVITFSLRVPGAGLVEAVRAGLARAGYHRGWRAGALVELADLPDAQWVQRPVDVVQDRVRLSEQEQARLHESVQQALKRGAGVVDVWLQGRAEGARRLLPMPAADEASSGAADPGWVRHRGSTALRCEACEVELPDASPQLFSFNSPIGACPACNGFGRVMDIDWQRCVPDPSLSLRGRSNSLASRAIRPWSTGKTAWERKQLYAFCDAVGIDTQAPWSELPEAHRQRIIEGHKGPGAPRYYGLREWFKWLEGRTYKMHVRVQLARYRKYVPCPTCEGRRLRPEALSWKLGPPDAPRDLPGWYAAPIDEVAVWLGALRIDPREAEAIARPLDELRARIELLRELGLGYLTLGRAGRTLSGGELQRVQLVSALSSGLSQVLYVLDEPSVGLHPMDNHRLMRVLRRLRGAGNTVVMVEHDPALIQAADMLVDLGPGAGEQGGEVVFAGPLSALHTATRSLTADYLLGRKQVLPHGAVGVAGAASWLEIVAPTAHNLRGQTVRLRKGALNVVCGVSGSGKSTLVEEVLHRGLLRQLGEATDEPGAHGGLRGTEGLREVVLVEQAPMGGSSRANCATYLKAWDAVRRRLAAEPLARERGHTAASFSFNRPGGRCEACEGAGVELVDMQFLSDVQITCEACGGLRFKREVLEIRHRGRSAADFLAMTAAEVAEEFSHDRALSRPMRAMCDLGLHYLRLGQPLSTLSGGETQRLKIAHHLMCARTRGALLLLDEPSTGLHLDDVRVLVANLRRLVAAGNTVVVVEHHLDLIAAADHLVELGPGGGPEGGQVLFQGTPAALRAQASTITATYLTRHVTGTEPALTDPGPSRAEDPGCVRVQGARVHNLRDLHLDIPRDKLTVVTGLSGSGKSSLAFDVVFAEGQRRFLDCLSPYARQYLPPVLRPDVDNLLGLPPTIAIAQRTTRGGTRSTVGTLTDIHPYLRLLFARCGVQHCPRCGDPVTGQGPEDIAASIASRCQGRDIFVMTPAIRGRKGWHRDVIERHREAGRRWVRADGELWPIDKVPELERYRAHDLDEVVAWLPWAEAQLAPAIPRRKTRQLRLDLLQEAVQDAIEAGDGTVLVQEQGGPLHVFAVDRHCGRCDLGVEPPDPLLFAFNSARGWCPQCRGKGVPPPPPKAPRLKRKRKRKPARDREAEQAADEKEAREGEDEPSRLLPTCPACEGSRLRPEARSVRIGGRSIDAWSAMTPGALAQALQAVPWRPREARVAEAIVAEVLARCAFLLRTGLDYLPLDRGAVTLSGGESQRIRLSSQLSSNLRGVLYVLDEPTIGLHPADNRKLLQAFESLVARGNGVLVVEHDEETIRCADHVIELGPGGGEQGGQLLHAGPLADLLADPDSPTGAVLARPELRRSRAAPRPVTAQGPWIRLTGARRNNLQGVDVAFARGRLNAVSGVSGSGKSTLVRDLLVRRGNALLDGDPNERPATEDLTDGDGLQGLEGLEGFSRVVEVDQSPIGRTPRSCPATYIGVFDPIRARFAALPEAKVRGLTASRFSFNVPGGRCETCKGAGQEKLEMSFLPAGYVPCPACGGSRYDRETLAVRYKGASIADVLSMSMADAHAHFAHVPAIARPLSMAVRTGLHYLRLGQGSHTVSGGEAQRLKLVAELCKRRRHETLYVLDEPSTGLHLADQKRLLDVLHDLVDRGDTLVVIEHNLDLLREADHLVDLGPGGGVHGGRVCWQGPVQALVDSGQDTPTARALRSPGDVARAGPRGQTVAPR